MSNLSRRSLIAGVVSLPFLAACSSSSRTQQVTSATSSLASQTKGASGVSLPSVSHEKDITPTRLQIPMLNFDKPVVSGGLVDGEIDPKQGTVQWFNQTVEPGVPGHSVIAGHVTYNGKPDVFANLEKIQVGAHISVFAENGSSRTFVVSRTKSIDKDALEHDMDVWGSTQETSLVLITCDAKSKLVGVHHVNNFVVWATPSQF